MSWHRWSLPWQQPVPALQAVPLLPLPWFPSVPNWLPPPTTVSVPCGGHGGVGDEEPQQGDGMERDFHSKEFEKAELERLLNPVERPSWEQFKEQQRKKGEMEGAEARTEEEEQRVASGELAAPFCRPGQ